MCNFSENTIYFSFCISWQTFGCILYDSYFLLDKVFSIQSGICIVSWQKTWKPGPKRFPLDNHASFWRIINRLIKLTLPFLCPYSVPRCPCHDLHRFRLSDDLPEEVWFWRCGVQLLHRRSHYTVGNHRVRLPQPDLRRGTRPHRT